jgi:hypothetical protein
VSSNLTFHASYFPSPAVQKGVAVRAATPMTPFVVFRTIINFSNGGL